MVVSVLVAGIGRVRLPLPAIRVFHLESIDTNVRPPVVVRHRQPELVGGDCGERELLPVAALLLRGYPASQGRAVVQLESVEHDIPHWEGDCSRSSWLPSVRAGRWERVPEGY